MKVHNHKKISARVGLQFLIFRMILTIVTIKRVVTISNHPQHFNIAVKIHDHFSFAMLKFLESSHLVNIVMI